MNKAEDILLRLNPGKLRTLVSAFEVDGKLPRLAAVDICFAYDDIPTTEVGEDLLSWLLSMADSIEEWRRGYFAANC